MKLIAVLSLVASVMLAQTNPPQKTQTDEQKRMVQLRAEFIRKHHPLRVVNGTLYDFTPFFVAYDADDGDLERFHSYMIRGKVIQVLSDGVLIDEKKSHLTVFIINWHNEGSAFDGSSVATLAVLVGRHKYTTTSGSVSTVLKYDCGHYYDPETEEFQSKKIVFKGGGGTEKEVPISAPLDISASKLAKKN